ncbi:MAG: hypothetical protein FWF38_07925, partial [Spirochaetaceae bacterium]|nr:hypothetical protein [Spirochaetaceae bacterium]
TGYDKNVLETGNFYFRWQKLIPKNSKTYIINNVFRKRDITVSGILPSGNIYSQVMQGNPDFSYSVSTTVTYSISKDLIVEKGSIELFDLNQTTGIDNFFIETDKSIQSLLKNYIETSFLANIEGTQNNANIDLNILSQEKLKEKLIPKMSGIIISDLAVINSSFPDINLYRVAAKQYMEVLADKKKILLEAELKTASRDAELAKKFETLQKYGELLNKYPILLDYFMINPNGDILKESEKLR